MDREDQMREVCRSDGADQAGRHAEVGAADKVVESAVAVAVAGSAAADAALEAPVDVSTNPARGSCPVRECHGSAGQVIQLATDDGEVTEEKEQKAHGAGELSTDATSSCEPDLISQLKGLTLEESANKSPIIAIHSCDSREGDADSPAAASDDNGGELDDDGGELTSHGPQHGRAVPMSNYGHSVVGQQQQMMHAVYRSSDCYSSPFGMPSGPQIKRSVPVEIDETNQEPTADLAAKFRYDGLAQSGARSEAAFDEKFNDLSSWLDMPSMLLQQPQQQQQQQQRPRYGSVTTASESSWDSVDSPYTIATASSPASSCDSSSAAGLSCESSGRTTGCSSPYAACGYVDEAAAVCSPQSWPPSPLSCQSGPALPLQQLKQLLPQPNGHMRYTGQKWLPSPATSASGRSSSSGNSSGGSVNSASAQSYTGSTSGSCLPYDAGFGFVVDRASGTYCDAQVPAPSPVSVLSDACTLYSESSPIYCEMLNKQQEQQRDEEEQEQQQQLAGRLPIDDEFAIIAEALETVEGKPLVEDILTPGRQQSFPQLQEQYLLWQQQVPSVPRQQHQMSEQQLHQRPITLQQQQEQLQQQQPKPQERSRYPFAPTIPAPMHVPVPVTTVSLPPTISPTTPSTVVPAAGSLLIVIPSPPVQSVAAQQQQQQHQRQGKKEQPRKILPAPPSDSTSQAITSAGKRATSVSIAVSSNLGNSRDKPQERADMQKASGPASEQRLLIARRAIASKPDGDLRQQDAEGNTFLHQAVAKPDAYMVRAILERLFRSESIRGMVNLTNKAGQTAVYLATIRNLSVIVKLLVQCHADVNIHAQCPEFQAPLHYAASNGERTLEVLSCLLKARFVDVNIKLGSSGRTPLHCAVFSHGRADPETNRPMNAIPAVRALLAANARLDLQDEPDARTPLHYAVASGCFELVQEIVAAASVPSVDAALRSASRQNDTCLHLAAAIRPSSPPAAMDRTAILRLLLKYGARTTVYNVRRQRPADLLLPTDDPELRRLLE